MAAIPYDEMDEKDPPSERQEADEMGPSDPADDDEFMMHAEEAGFTGEKAKALWRAVARCVELLPSAMPMGEEEA